MFATRNLHMVGNSTPYEVLQRGSLRSCLSKVDALYSFHVNQFFDALGHEPSPVISNGINGI